MMKKVLLAVAVLGLGSSIAAHADPVGTTETFSLTVDTCGCGTGSAFGTITLDQIAVGTVSVTETLYSGIHFVGTGAGQGLEFSLNGDPNLSTLTFAGLNPAAPAKPNWSTGSSGKDSPFAKGDYYVTCNGLACDNGNSKKYAGPLTFTLTSTAGVDISDFVPIDTCYQVTKSSSCEVIYLSSDLLGPNGTGVIGAVAGQITYPPPPPSATPEPSSLALLGTGVLGLAGVIRRRFGK